MPRLEPLADLDPGTTSPKDASASLFADSQVSTKDCPVNKPGVAVPQLYFDPENDLQIIDAGQKLAHLLAEGDVQNFGQMFADYSNQIADVSDPTLQARIVKDFANGLESTNPTDLDFTRDAAGKPTSLFINVESEIYVNESFGLLDKYSTCPQLDPKYINPASTPEQAAANATLHVNTLLEKMKDSLDANTALDDTSRQALLTMYGADFIADFNRRRLENNYLPNFIAHTDENGHVEIAYVDPNEGEPAKK